MVKIPRTTPQTLFERRFCCIKAACLNGAAVRSNASVTKQAHLTDLHPLLIWVYWRSAPCPMDLGWARCHTDDPDRQAGSTQSREV